MVSVRRPDHHHPFVDPELLVLSAYAPLFRVPGALPFIAGTTLSRTGGAMFGVAVIVMLSERRGSFGLAGAVSAVGLAVLAVAGPVIGRLVDKHGQRRVALPFVLVSAACGLTVVVLSWRDAPAWTLFLFYGLSAVLPEPGPMSRARWAHIFRHEPQRLHTAMSFEQVADEASFVVGPVLAVLVSTLWFPEAGLLLAELLFTAGMLTFLAARATEPPVVPHADRPTGFAVRRPGLLLVATALVMTGVIFGANEVIAVAYAKEAGQTGFASVILGAFALGSTLAGIVFGSRVFRSTMTRRLVIAATGMFVLEVPALLVDGLWPLAVVMFVAGSATAPLLITSLSLAQRLVPKALVTEGMAVAVTGILIGISAGSAVGGWAIEAWGAQLAYAVPVVSGGLALALIALRYRHLEGAELAGGRALEQDSTPVTA
jgi:predicted MFS family arabinose efflux permease